MNPLKDEDMNSDPWVQFAQWFESAKAEPAIRQPDAMDLSTINEQGYPDGRFVLLKGFDAQGFVFYTNMNSVKGRSLLKTPRAAIAFFWEPLARQVRAVGDIVPVSDAESDDYFRSRPRLSQIGAWASLQSEPLPARETLDRRVADLEKQYAGRDVPRPPHWRGNRLIPHRIEFWQGRANRLHDRFVYERAGKTWAMRRLYP